MALFTVGSSRLAVDTLQTVRYYMGLSPVYSHVIPNGLGVLTFPQQLRYLLGNHVFMIGLPGLIAVVVLLVRRPANGLLLVFSLASPWILWTVVMRTHTAFHSFELLIAAPLAALALAWIAAAGLRSGWSMRGALKMAVVVALATSWTFLVRPKNGGDAMAKSRFAMHLMCGGGAGCGRCCAGADGFGCSAVLLGAAYWGVANDGVLAEELQDIREQFPGFAGLSGDSAFACARLRGDVVAGNSCEVNPGCDCRQTLDLCLLSRSKNRNWDEWGIRAG